MREAQLARDSTSDTDNWAAFKVIGWPLIAIPDGEYAFAAAFERLRISGAIFVTSKTSFREEGGSKLSFVTQLMVL